MSLDLDSDGRPGSLQRQSGAGKTEVAPLLIHIGFHKAGSTWLQQELLNNPEFGFSNSTGELRQQIIMRIGVPDPLSYDASTVASHYAPLIETANKAGRTLTLSHEQLSGHPSSGGRDRRLIADRLRETFPDARILIVFREQRALIQSMYSQHITAGGVESLRHFLSVPEPWCGRRPSFAFEHYEFDKLIRYYRDLFGPDRVLALPLELLGADPAQFASRISTFCGHQKIEITSGERMNVRRPQLMQLIQRPLNMLFFHNDLSPGALIHIKRFNKRYRKYLLPLFQILSPKFVDKRILARQKRTIDQIVGDRYAESNRRTQEQTGLPLREFGYPVK
jgi:hypothetical protein